MGKSREERKGEERKESVSKTATPDMGSAPKIELEKPPEKVAILREETRKPGEKRPPVQEDYCSKVEDGVQDFFSYLNRASYVRHLEKEGDSYDHFKGMIRKLSSQPPIPAGEGMDSRIIHRNIFHFFRLLDRDDLRLIKEIMRNESDTLELNLDIFYKWLMLGERCPDPEGIRPRLDVLYQYAGFLTNTIGGRAYLFRRPLGIRLLVSYYSLLIVHEADRLGKNTYGIDIFPVINSLAKEISIYPDFHFQNDYIQQLTGLQNYYLKKR
jgi:hypothetical protein